jgi:hypothetical protein
MSPIYVPGKVTLAKDYVPVDPDFNNVSLLLHGDGTNGSTTITDSSPTPKTVTANGNAQISTAQSKFGGSSIAFDGSSYLTLDGSSAFTYGASDFTIELWMRRNSTSTAILYDDRPQGSGSIANRLVLSAQTVIGVTFKGQGFSGSTTLDIGVWYHIAACRSGTTSRVFVNGQAEITVTDDNTSYATGTSRPIIGADGNSPTANRLNGYVDDYRITKGVARYTSNFTPPTAPFPDIESR